MSESQISTTDQTTMPFMVQCRDVHLKIRRSPFAYDVQIVDSRLLASKEVLIPFDSLLSYETLKPCVLSVLLRLDPINSDLILLNLIENIVPKVCDTFIANQMKWVRTLGFFVDIEFQTVEECEEDEDTVMREIMETTMEEGPAMVPASKESIEKLLNTRKFEEKEIGGEACRICLEEFSVGLEVKVMPCAHVFHGDCIITWLQQSHYCPLCRFSMPVDAD
ncbi:hypothetical protein NE237_023582 [Protea cynaroides]|uniref:RING-type domain-containing protein n=1 Tax=Protea cynaroides TaxID=273540 RepID=A0A9Q0HCE9_9MAGN|nr:hypothetical protein NE237_023582 [Protea cynaroides]